MLTSALCVSSLIAALGISFTASARNWSRDDAALAKDYSFIDDRRGDGQHVLVVWLNSMLPANEATTQTVRSVLDKYVVIGLSDGRPSSDGRVQYEQISVPALTDGKKSALQRVEPGAIPATDAAALSQAEEMFGHSFGLTNQNVRWFVYNAGPLSACGTGTLLVPYQDETYRYDLPIPGCAGRK